MNIQKIVNKELDKYKDEYGYARVTITDFGVQCCEALLKDIDERLDKLVIDDLTQPEFIGWNRCLEKLKDSFSLGQAHKDGLSTLSNPSGTTKDVGESHNMRVSDQHSGKPADLVSSEFTQDNTSACYGGVSNLLESAGSNPAPAIPSEMMTGGQLEMMAGNGVDNSNLGGLNATPKPRIYGAWAGNPKGIAEDTQLCIKEVYDKFTLNRYQCQRKRGYGTNGLYCKQHAKKEDSVQ